MFVVFSFKLLSRFDRADVELVAVLLVDKNELASTPEVAHISTKFKVKLVCKLVAGLCKNNKSEINTTTRS